MFYNIKMEQMRKEKPKQLDCPLLVGCSLGQKLLSLNDIRYGPKRVYRVHWAYRPIMFNVFFLFLLVQLTDNTELSRQNR